MTQSLNQNTRIAVVDALRGFAVMAILLVHNLEHFIFPVYPTDSPSWLSTLNQGVFTSIFALLFGFTFYIQPAINVRREKTSAIDCFSNCVFSSIRIERIDHAKR